MTPEAQRIAIAKVCGWTDDDLLAIRRANEMGTAEEDNYPPVPDFLNDLNAMHTAEKALTGTDVEDYFDEVAKLVPDRLGMSGILRATAATRAKAFLKLRNLWTDK